MILSWFPVLFDCLTRRFKSGSALSISTLNFEAKFILHRRVSDIYSDIAKTILIRAAVQLKKFKPIRLKSTCDSRYMT